MKNLIVSVSDDYQSMVCEELSDYEDMQICGVLDYRNKPGLKTLKNDAFLWTLEDILNFHQRDNLFSEADIHCGSDFWINIRKYEQFFLSITDRLSFYPVSTTELRRIYYSFVLRWVKAYSDSSANTVIFFSTPHMGFDFVGYSVAEVLGLDVRIINRTGLFLSSRLTNRVDLWNNKSNIDLIPGEWNRDYFDSNKFITDVSILRSSKINSRVLDQNRKKFRSFKLFSRMIARNVVQLLLKLQILLKQRSLLSIYWISGPRNRFQILLENLINYWRSRALFKKYCDECVKDLPSSPFVFFPAHFQPERSTTPEGGCFDENLLAIESLLNCLPEGMNVVYKEHPRQFDMYDMRRKFARNSSYYKRINSYRNVILVEPTWDASEIIEKSIVVATITGTSGWEALKTGKPCIVFGDAWYRNCTACLHVSDLSENSVAELLKLDKVTVEKRVRDFIDYAKKSFVHAASRNQFLILSDEESNAIQHAQRMARALHDTLC